jgi:hypothetical protein
VIYEALDLVVWGATLLVFVLLGARAWAVETSGARLYRTSARVRVLTIGSWLAGVALVVLLAVQGGILLTQAILTSTDPSDFVSIVPVDPPPPAPPAAPPADQAPGPDAPPGAGPGAPPADGGDAPPAAPGEPGAAPDGGAPGAP